MIALHGSCLLNSCIHWCTRRCTLLEFKWSQLPWMHYYMYLECLIDRALRYAIAVFSKYWLTITVESITVIFPRHLGNGYRPLQKGKTFVVQHQKKITTTSFITIVHLLHSREKKKQKKMSGLRGMGPGSRFPQNDLQASTKCYRQTNQKKHKWHKKFESILVMFLSFEKQVNSRLVGFSTSCQYFS